MQRKGTQTANSPNLLVTIQVHFPKAGKATIMQIGHQAVIIVREVMEL